MPAYRWLQEILFAFCYSNHFPVS